MNTLRCLILSMMLCMVATLQAHAAVTIDFYGDSTTRGAQTLNGRLYNTDANEPALVQIALRQWFNRTDITVNNQGVGGTEASQLLYGTDGVHAPFAQVMQQSTAQIVVINFALNDSYYNVVPHPGVISESPDAYWSYMSQLCAIARQYGKICVFQEPNPVNGVQDPNAPIYAYVYALRQMAAQINAPLVPQWDAFLQLPGWLGWLSEDGTHPKDEAYAWKAWNTTSTLVSIVGPLLN